MVIFLVKYRELLAPFEKKQLKISEKDEKRKVLTYILKDL